MYPPPYPQKAGGYPQSPQVAPQQAPSGGYQGPVYGQHPYQHPQPAPAAAYQAPQYVPVPSQGPAPGYPAAQPQPAAPQQYHQAPVYQAAPPGPTIAYGRAPGYNTVQSGPVTGYQPPGYQPPQGGPRPVYQAAQPHVAAHPAALGHPVPPPQTVVQPDGARPPHVAHYQPQPAHAAYSHPATVRPTQPMHLQQPPLANGRLPSPTPPPPNPGSSGAADLVSSIATKLSALSVSVANQSKPLFESVIKPYQPPAVTSATTTGAPGYQTVVDANPGLAAIPNSGSAASLTPNPATSLAAKSFDGPPNEYPIWCLLENTTYEAVWYQDKAEKWLIVCGRCWVDHLLLSVFAPQFERVTRPRGSNTRCRFHTPRIKDLLWPRAVSELNYEPLRQFAKTREKIPDCTDLDTNLPQSYHVPLDGSMKGARFCSACFEDRLVTAGFADKFRISTEPIPSGEDAACSLADDGLQDALALYARAPNGWSSFVTAVTNRIAVSACKLNWPYPEPPPRQFTTKRPIDDWAICESCYITNIAYHPFAAEFTEILPRPAARKDIVFVCDGNSSAISAALDVAKRTHDFATFWTAAAAISRQPRCVGTGMPNATWYTLPGLDNFDVCGACHAGILTTMGVSRYFVVVKHEPDKPDSRRYCNLLVDQMNPTFLPLLQSLVEAVAKQSFSIFSTRCTMITSLPACPRMTAQKEGRWFGWQECTFCELCWLVDIADSALGARAELRGESGPQLRVCNLGTQRTRREWRKANEKADLEQFLAFARKRRQVYEEVQPKLEATIQMHRMLMDRAVNAMQQESFYNTLHNTENIRFGNESGPAQYWDSATGTYGSKNQITANQYRKEFQDLMSQAQQQTMIMGQLESVLNTVE